MDRLPEDSAETRRLLELAASGARGAVDSLLQRHRPAVLEFVEHRFVPKLQGRLDPSDVVQEAEIEATRRMRDYLRRRPMPFRLWLCRTAYQRLQMARRRHLGAARRDARRERPLPDASSVALAQRLACRGSSPLSRAVRAERTERVRAALDRLADEDREVLLMRNYEGRDYAAVAAILDVTPAAARQRHGRALLRLSELLKESEAGGPTDE